MVFLLVLNVALIVLGIYIFYRVVKAAVKAAIKESFDELNILPPTQEQNPLP